MLKPSHRFRQGVSRWPNPAAALVAPSHEAQAIKRIHAFYNLTSLIARRSHHEGGAVKRLSPILLIGILSLAACSESPDPRIGEPYYDSLEELDDEYSDWWQPYRPRPGYNKTTYIFSQEPLNLRVMNVSRNQTTQIIGWRLERTKGWWTNEYRDMFLLEIEYYCETSFKFLIEYGFQGSDKGRGKIGIGSGCEILEY